MEQKREPMNKNRIRGLRWRASELLIAKPISIKFTGGKSGGSALKAVELTSGDLRHVTKKVTEDEAIHPDRVAEVSKGQSRSGSRQGYGGTPSRKAEQQIGRAGNDDRRPERYPARGIKERASKRCDS